MNIMNNPKHAIVDIYLSTYKKIYLYLLFEYLNIYSLLSKLNTIYRCLCPYLS